MLDIYLDNSATTQPYPEVVSKVTEMITKKYGNPSSLHRLGVESKQEIEKVRLIIADSLEVQPKEIYFTSGGTESDNLAIMGACLANASNGNRIITTVAEHAAVTKTIRNLKRQGWEVIYIPAPGGVLDLEEMEKAINHETVLVSAMLVNNEIGSIFPIDKIKQMIQHKNSPALLHCDAVQGYGKVNFTADSIGADLVSISAHKIHGIKGSGALYVKDETKMFTNMFGGGQENGLRSGTESSPLITAFGEAVRITFSHIEKDILRMAELRDYCSDSIKEKLPNSVIHSSKKGAPHIVNFSLQGFRNREVVEFLDKKGIYISSAAACKSNHSRGPSMLESLGISRELADSALRVSFSPMSTKDEIDTFIRTLVEYVNNKN